MTLPLMYIYLLSIFRKGAVGATSIVSLDGTTNKDKVGPKKTRSLAFMRLDGVVSSPM